MVFLGALINDLFSGAGLEIGAVAPMYSPSRAMREGSVCKSIAKRLQVDCARQPRNILILKT